MREFDWKRLLLCMGAVIILVLIVVFTIRASSAEEKIEFIDEYIVGVGCEQEEWVSDEEETEGEPEEEPVPMPADSDARVIAQVLYYEIGAGTKLAQSAVVWVILNRVDSELAYFPDTIEEVCKQKIGKTPMFAYDPEAPVRDDLYDMAMDVMTRWYREKRGEENVGRTLPVEYVYFWGNGKTNFFRIEYQGKDYWDWSLPNPYEVDEP